VPDTPPKPSSASAQAAQDLVDAATGLDGRAWVTLRDLVIRPWDMIRRAAFENDPRYVGAVKISLVMSTFAIVLMSWLLSGEGYFTRLQAAEPAAWARLNARLEASGVCLAHFIDRFSSRHELLNTLATLVECGVLAVFFYVLDRRRRFVAHLSFALYCYALWLLVTVPLQFVMVAGLSPVAKLAVALGMIVLLPGLMFVGLLRLYPTSWPRQVGRALALLLLTGGLFFVMTAAIARGAMAWTLLSFGL